MFLEIIHGYFRDLSCEPNIQVSSSISKIRVRLVPISSHVIFFLTVPSRYFFCGSFFINLCLSLPYCLVYGIQPCGHLLGKGRLLSSPVCDAFL